MATSLPLADVAAVQLNPPQAEFQGPFERPVRSSHTVKNTGSSRLVIKVKVSEPQLLRAKPACAFLTPNDEVPMNFQCMPFTYKSTDSYERRKFAIFFATAPETASDAVTFAKEVGPADWRIIKVSTRYVLPSATPTAESKQPSAGPAANGSTVQSPPTLPSLQPDR